MRTNRNGEQLPQKVERAKVMALASRDALFRQSVRAMLTLVGARKLAEADPTLAAPIIAGFEAEVAEINQRLALAEQICSLAERSA